MAKTRTRARQPQELTGIDWGNPLSRGLAAWYVGTGDALWVKANPAYSLGNPGTAFQGNGSSASVYKSVDRNIGLAATPATIYAVVQGSSAADTRAFAVADAGSYIAQVGSGLSAAAKGRLWWRGPGADVGTVDTVNTVFETGKPHGFALAYVGTALSAYVDGVLDTTQTVAAASGSPAAQQVAAGALVRAGSAVAFSSAQIYVGFFWHRELSAAEHATLHANPWQLFSRPQRRSREHVAAGGTHATTGALAADVSTIAGTAAHLTLHTTSGAMSAAAAAIAGTATHLTLHTTTGALSSAAAAIAGAATHPHTTTGALTAAAATIAGAAAHLTLHTTTGALSADAAVIAGAAAHLAPGTHTTTGALAADPATVAGTATHLSLHATTGALAATQAVISGAAAHLTLHTTSGALAASSATVAGLALNGTAPVVTVSYGDLSFGPLPKRKRRSLALEGLREELEQALSPPAATPLTQTHPAWEPVAFVPELAAALTAVRRASVQSPEVVEIRTIRRAITLAHEAQATYKRKVRRQRQQHYLLMEL